MEQSEAMNNLVDKVADKFQMAFGKAEPIVEEVVRQFQMSRLASSIFLFILFLSGITCIVVGIKLDKKYRQHSKSFEDDLSPWSFVGVVVLGFGGILMTLIGGCLGCSAFLDALFPLPGMLKL